MRSKSVFQACLELPVWIWMASNYLPSARIKDVHHHTQWYSNFKHLIMFRWLSLEKLCGLEHSSYRAPPTTDAHTPPVPFPRMSAFSFCVIWVVTGISHLRWCFWRPSGLNPVSVFHCSTLLHDGVKSQLLPFPNLSVEHNIPFGAHYFTQYD